MRIDKAAWPLVGPAVAAAGLAGVAGGPLLAAPLLVLAAALLFFFRDPERRAPDDPRAIVSPADGRVLVAGPARPEVSPPGRWLQVSIFLSPLDVHVNRAPIGGLVKAVEYVAGRFLAAYRPEASEQNERCAVSLDGDRARVAVTQISGVLARRVVCRVRPGDTLRAGERYGLIRFGSRTDLVVPRGTELRVRVRDRVRGGESVMGVLR